MPEFSAEDLALLIEALATAASRHESQARFNPRAAGPHDRKAKKMRELRAGLLALLIEASVPA